MYSQDINIFIVLLFTGFIIHKIMSNTTTNIYHTVSDVFYESQMFSELVQSQHASFWTRVHLQFANNCCIVIGICTLQKGFIDLLVTEYSKHTQ